MASGLDGTLAILGAVPAFRQPVHVGRPNLGDRVMFRRLVEQCLDRCWLTNDGPLVQQFEAEIAAHCGVRHCVAMSNGTVALQAAIRACELSGEVIVPSFTFIATAHALAWQAIQPVFCDIDRASHTLDVNAVCRAITPRTTAILGVHLWGECCDVQQLSAIADKHRLKLIFDSAHAFGCSCHGQPVGSFGNCEVLSFHATKFVQSAEGGAVVTNDDVLAERLRLIRNFGFRGPDDVCIIGTNAKMSELSAAMGLTSLHSMKEIVRTNERNYELYHGLLSELPGVRVFEFNRSEQRNFQYVVAEISEDQCPLTRDELVCVLHAENVMARRYFFPGIHRMDAYRQQLQPDLPVTDFVSQSVLILPTGSSVSPSTIRQISKLLKTAIARAPEVRACIDRQKLTPASIRIVHDYTAIGETSDEY